MDDAARLDDRQAKVLCRQEWIPMDFAERPWPSRVLKGMPSRSTRPGKAVDSGPLGVVVSNRGIVKRTEAVVQQCLRVSFAT